MDSKTNYETRLDLEFQVKSSLFIWSNIKHDSKGLRGSGHEPGSTFLREEKTSKRIQRESIHTSIITQEDYN